MATTLDDEPLCLVVGCAEPMIGLRMPGQQGLCLGHGLEVERARRDYVAPDASNWTAGDLIRAVDRSGDGVVEATFWGISVDFWCAGFENDDPDLIGPWSVTVYPGDAEEIISPPVPYALAVLQDARRLVRDYMPTHYDEWLCRRAIASGLQPVLF